MAKTRFSARRTINGTFGQVWRDGVMWAETTALQVKLDKTKTDVDLCGSLMTDTKVTKVKGKGSVTIYHVDSALPREEAEAILNGEDLRHTIVSKLDDPDAYGAERISVTGVSFDDITFADWKAATAGTVTLPFTYTGIAFLDYIEET
jgi:hypothetical protein